MAIFCTCKNLSCKLHPNNHEQGCTPCIANNLKTKEMPSCFFNLVAGADKRENDSLTCFAELVLAEKNKQEQ